MRNVWMIAVVFCISCNAPAQVDKGTEHSFNTSDVVDSGIAFFSTILKTAIPDSSDTDFLKKYAELKTAVLTKRAKLSQAYLAAATEDEKRKILDSCQTFLHEALTNNIFPFWYGTAWDFNGISNEPQRGQIACGYFVSTTLKHCGFNLNRYKVAQQYSHSIVKTLCTNERNFTEIDQLLAYVAATPNQLYVVGLDNHVGFISNHNGEITFVHSTFVDNACVITEKADESLVLKNSHRYVLGNLLENDALLLIWLRASAVVIRY